MRGDVVLRGERLEAHSATSAPPACQRHARFAVSVVTCRHASSPLARQWLLLAKRSRSWRSNRMERSAHFRAAPPFVGEAERP